MHPHDVDQLRRATERHELLKRRKERRRQLREIERRLQEGRYDDDDWLDDELPRQGA